MGNSSSRDNNPLILSPRNRYQPNETSGVIVDAKSEKDFIFFIGISSNPTCKFYITNTSTFLQTDFELFKAHGQYPRNPDCSYLLTSLSNIKRENSVLIFVSHVWRRGWPGSIGWNGIPHPDNLVNSDYENCVEGIEVLIDNLTTDAVESVYIWLDYGNILHFPSTVFLPS